MERGYSSNLTKETLAYNLAYHLKETCGLENAHEINTGVVPERTSAQYLTYAFNDANVLKNEVLKCKANEINFKKHLEEDKMKSIKYANQGLLEKFVDQIDLFDSVVNMKTDDPVLKNFLIGFEMINNNFKQILSDEGVKKIIVKVGDDFDPKFHHPFDTDWNEEYKENAILGELKGGYTYKDRVLRPTLVKINKKEEVKENE